MSLRVSVLPSEGVGGVCPTCGQAGYHAPRCHRAAQRSVARVSDDGERYQALKKRVHLFEQPNGKFRHWLLLSIESESPDFDEAVGELIAKRQGGK